MRSSGLRASGLVCCFTSIVVLAWACGSSDATNNGAGGGASSSGASSSSGAASSSGGTSSGGASSSSGTGAPDGGGPIIPPTATCAAAGGSATVSTPNLIKKLDDDGDEAWLSSPAIIDIDGDGKPEIIVARGRRIYAWHADGTRVLTYDTGKDRIWASPIVANFTGDANLEIAVAARDSAFLIDAKGAAITGFPKLWGGSESRTIAAGDVDGDGALDIVIGAQNGGDIVTAFHANGSAVAGFPPVKSGVSGCTPGPCYFAGLYDQNLAIGDLDKDGKQDLVMPHDDAYASFFHGTGVVFDSNPMFVQRTKVSGVRYLHDLDEAKQGYANDEATANQAHFTNTPPAIADVDKDGTYDIIMVGSVQNAAQTDRLRGVDLWLLHSDASRLTGWEAPFQAPDYVVGLSDGFAHGLNDPPIAGADNLVGLTNQVTIADIDKKPGLEMIFAGYDGKIHCVAADKTELWSTPYATDGRALTAGIVVADLSADGVPEIVFTTYSPDANGGNLFVLSSTGQQLYKIALPTRGSMAVPTIGDADGNGTLDIVVPIKGDSTSGKDNTLIFEVPGSKANCMLWPTGRANYLRNGWLP